VRILERITNLGRDAHRMIDSELRLAGELVAERLAVDERRHVIEEAVRVAAVEQRRYVRMLKARRRFDLDKKTLGPKYRGELGLQNFQRNLAIVLQIFGQINGRHSALAELAVDAVPVC
jgi:hypothetical protein